MEVLDSIMEEITMEDVEESVTKHESRKRRCNDGIQGDDSLISDMLSKKMMQSFTKPSRPLGLGPSSKSFRWEHRERLRKILCKLLGQHNWKEASGVLSVLLQGSKKEKYPPFNRFKYSAAMDLLKYVHGENVNPLRMKNIYDTWISRTGSRKDVPMEGRSLVYLEQILFFLLQGDDEDASQAASSLMQRHDFENHPLSLMVLGLTFYQLWYSKFLKEINCEDVGQLDSPSQSNLSGTKFGNQVGWSEGEGDNAVYSHETRTIIRHNSETSIMNDKRMSMEFEKNQDTAVSMEFDVKLERVNVPQLSKPFGFSVSSDENQASLHKNVAHTYDASFFSILDGVPSWLLPLRLPQNPDYYIQMLNNPYYKDAVKYLQLALYSAPPVLAALHPLIQLLLIGGQIDNAMNEVEKFCHNSNAAFAFRIRTAILECFNHNDPMLSKYYEDILKKDPTCSRSLGKLVKMHQNGDYSAESLLEMIALHLDAGHTGGTTWKEFALCFLKLSRHEEDTLSACLDRNDGEQKQRFSICYNRTPEVFTERKSGKGWRLRCRWWLTRHFSNKVLASEIAAGDMELLTYKAACGSHLYGQEFGYVLKVYNLLEKHKNRDLFMFLRMHMQYSIRIQHSMQQRTNL